MQKTKGEWYERGAQMKRQPMDYIIGRYPNGPVLSPTFVFVPGIYSIHAAKALFSFRLSSEIGGVDYSDQRTRSCHRLDELERVLLAVT